MGKKKTKKQYHFCVALKTWTAWLEKIIKTVFSGRLYSGPRSKQNTPNGEAQTLIHNNTQINLLQFIHKGRVEWISFLIK